LRHPRLSLLSLQVQLSMLEFLRRSGQLVGQSVRLFHRPVIGVVRPGVEVHRVGLSALDRSAFYVYHPSFSTFSFLPSPGSENPPAGSLARYCTAASAEMVSNTEDNTEDNTDPVASASVPEKAPKPKSKERFERTTDHEIFKTLLISEELEEAEAILRKYSENKDYTVESRTYNDLLRSWLRKEDLNRALAVWPLFARYGVRRTARSYSLILSGLVRYRRSSLLPTYVEALEKSKIRPERLLADRYYRRETARIPYTLSDPKNTDPSICIKLPPSCPRPDGTFHNPIHDDNIVPLSPYERQLESERSRVSERARTLRNSAKQLNEIGRTATLRPGRRLMIRWFQDIEKRLETEQTLIRRKIEDDAKVDEHQRQIVRMSADKLAVIGMHELLSHCIMNLNGTSFTTVCMSIGKAVQAEVAYGKIKREVKPGNKRFIERRAKNTHQRMKAINRLSAEDPEDWSKETILKVGSFLAALTMEHSSITVQGDDLFSLTTVPAFEHTHVSTGKKKTGMIVAHPEIINQLEPEEFQETLNVQNAKLLPMYVTPMPWTKHRKGGYIQAPTKIMRTYSQHQDQVLSTSDLSEVCNLLTILGELPWRINARVYDVVKEGWARGGNLPYVPSRQSIRSPTPPADFATSAESRLTWRQERNKTNQKNRERYSLRCDFLLKLKTAETLAGEEVFFFPHNMDFRGRCYPIPPHLNHMGSDLCRGLLEFAEGKPLGSHGLFWLKAHLAALCGVNKVSFDDRVKYAEENLAEIIDSAENPLDGNRWWLEADDAWQCLACCFELRDALRMKDPTKFVSHIPIHMDGSCNGLQHYAALGGDIDGGRSVNLLPADAPQDVYTHVLKIVQEQIEKDAEAGDPTALSLVGKVIRKTIKQTVMTSVYGVTYIGARKQISGQLRDQCAVPDEDLFAASVYVTKVTFDAMQSMFTQARQIMSWLGDTARAVSRTGATMAWTTPIGIPVEQHYRRPGRLQVKTLLQSVILAEHSDDLPVLVQKQRSAFPPNYVHSLDSTHMFKTAKACHDSGISFAAVHDSYWTHACSVDLMNSYLRQAFVELHSRPLLEELTNQIAVNHPDLKLDPYPTRGPLDIDQVKSSRYFFH